VSTLFAPSREDGRSDRQVVIDLVETSQPGDMLYHNEILEELREGTDRDIRREHVYRAANAASRWLIKHSKQALVPVRGQGYRVSVPDDFHGLTLVRRDRASTQLARGNEVVEHAPFGDMSDEIRQAMLPLAILISGAYGQLHAHHRRLARHDDVIAELAETVKKHDADLTELKRLKGE
jgi:hypothetical protein